MNFSYTAQQVITTKFLSPTNTKGSRIKATASDGLSITMLTVEYQHALNSSANHKFAVRGMLKKLDLEWNNVTYSETKTGYIYMCAD